MMSEFKIWNLLLTTISRSETSRDISSRQTGNTLVGSITLIPAAVKTAVALFRHSVCSSMDKLVIPPAKYTVVLFMVFAPLLIYSPTIYATAQLQPNKQPNSKMPFNPRHY
jgi:hypothetical protein